MPTAVLLPLATAVAFLVGAVVAYGTAPLTVHGDAYSHVPSHLITAGMSLLVALSTARLTSRSATVRGRRAVRWVTWSWAALGGAFALETVGAVIGDGSGDYTVHSAAAGVLLLSLGLLLVAHLLLLAAGRGVLPWPLRLLLPISIPGVVALVQGSSTSALALSLTAAVVWCAVGVSAARPSTPLAVPDQRGAVTTGGSTARRVRRART